MEGAIDLRTVLTLGGILFSVASASAIAKVQLRTLATQLDELQQTLKKLDARCDKLHTLTETQEQRIDILAKMSSPENLRRDHMQLAELISETKRQRIDIDHLIHIHNSKHIPVPDIRKAE